MFRLRPRKADTRPAEAAIPRGHGAPPHSSQETSIRGGASAGPPWVFHAVNRITCNTRRGRWSSDAQFLGPAAPLLLSLGIEHQGVNCRPRHLRFAGPSLMGRFSSTSRARWRSSYQVDSDKRIDEIARFDKALLVTRQQISKIQDEGEKNLGQERGPDLLTPTCWCLEDQALISETIREFEATGRNIETCFNAVSKGNNIQAFRRNRRRVPEGEGGRHPRRGAARPAQPARAGREFPEPPGREAGFVVANDLSPPSDSASHRPRLPGLAIVTDSGSKKRATRSSSPGP